MSNTIIKGVAFVSAYVDDFETSYKFYNEVLGLEKEYDMGKLACFFKLGNDSGLYLQGGNSKVTFEAKTMRTAYVLSVTSAFAMFEKLKGAGVNLSKMSLWIWGRVVTGFNSLTRQVIFLKF